MKTVYYLYKDNKPINSNALSENDVNEIKKHNTVRILVGRNYKEIPVNSLRVVKRIIV